MRRLTHLSMLMVAAGIAGCAAPVAPEKPTWQEDVYPLVRGSCAHCHGENAPKVAPAYRFDVCDPAAYAGSGVSNEVLTKILGGGSAAVAALSLIDLDDSKGRPRMPPPPGNTLSDYDLTVFKNWAKVTSAGSQSDICKKKGTNHEPKARLIGTPKWDGDKVTFTLDVTDADDDVVLGRISVGDSGADVLASGRRQYVVDGASMGDRITVKLSDGTATTGDLALNY